MFRPQESDRPADLREKADEDFGIGGTGMSLNGLSWADRNSSRPEISVDEGAVDAALNREESSVVDAVFVLEAPLPLHKVSIRYASKNRIKIDDFEGTL